MAVDSWKWNMYAVSREYYALSPIAMAMTMTIEKNQPNTILDSFGFSCALAYTV